MGNRPDDGGDTQIPSTVEEERNNKGGRFNSHTWLHFAVHIGVHFCLLCANQKLTTTGPAHFTEAAKNATCCDNIWANLQFFDPCSSNVKYDLQHPACVAFCWKGIAELLIDQLNNSPYTKANLALVSKGSLSFDPTWNSCSCHTPPSWLPHTTKVALLSSSDTRTQGVVEKRFIKELEAWLRAEQVFNPTSPSSRSECVWGWLFELVCPEEWMHHRCAASPSPTVQLTCLRPGEAT